MVTYSHCFYWFLLLQFPSHVCAVDWSTAPTTVSQINGNSRTAESLALVIIYTYCKLLLTVHTHLQRRLRAGRSTEHAWALSFCVYQPNSNSSLARFSLMPRSLSIPAFLSPSPYPMLAVMQFYCLLAEKRAEKKRFSHFLCCLSVSLWTQVSTKMTWTL